MTYTEALTYIHSVCWKGSQPGLSRITELMHRLGDPQNDLRFVHVVGTNGKGSTAAMIASVCTAAGYRTGLFISPYVLDFRERMQVDGEMISKNELIRATAAVRPHAEAMGDKPTEFELICAVGLWWFAKKRCDIVVLEAGMGGALDATNVIPVPEAAVFTNIGLDHTEYLGDTVEKIAETKAGILKRGSEAVLYPNLPSVEQVIVEKCRDAHVPVHRADPGRLTRLEDSLEGQVLRCGQLLLRLPLLGEHQRRNAAVALTTLEVLRMRGWEIPDRAIEAGFAAVRWPGRFEVLRREPPVILDGGHNPQCIRALKAAVQTYLRGRPLTMITGVLADKDYTSMYADIAPLADRIYTLTPPNPRALSAETLARQLEVWGKPVTACSSAAQAVTEALASTPPDGAVVAFGSLYLAGELRTQLLRHVEQ